MTCTRTALRKELTVDFSPTLPISLLFTYAIAVIGGSVPTVPTLRVWDLPCIGNELSTGLTRDFTWLVNDL